MKKLNIVMLIFCFYNYSSQEITPLILPPLGQAKLDNAIRTYDLKTLSNFVKNAQRHPEQLQNIALPEFTALEVISQEDEQKQRTTFALVTLLGVVAITINSIGSYVCKPLNPLDPSLLNCQNGFQLGTALGFGLGMIVMYQQTPTSTKTLTMLKTLHSIQRAQNKKRNVV